MLLQSINTPKNGFPQPGSATFDPGTPVSWWLLRAPVVFIHCLLLFGSGDASCLSHLKNALTSTKLQSQVPECLAKPCPPPPPAGCLNSNTTFISLCLGGSSSLSLRHAAHLLLFARASSSVLQGSVNFFVRDESLLYSHSYLIWY